MRIDPMYSFDETQNHPPYVLPRELTQVAAAAEAEIRKAIQYVEGVQRSTKATLSKLSAEPQ
jgi:hypothetical protein